jgi:diadenosine tetraphosphate (Ap4A) HIT family hydrolase
VSPASLAGFLIAQPKRHVEHIGELTREEALQIGVTLSRVAEALTTPSQLRRSMSSLSEIW